MGDYHVEGTQTVSGTDITTITIERGAAKRFKIFEFTSGFTLASPSDNLILVDAHRFDTADGTGTGRTPNALDQADGVAVATSQQNHTIEPTTYVTDEEVWIIGQHMRATYRWVAAPGKEIVVPDIAAEGVGWLANHASATPEHIMSVYFSE